MSAMTHGRLSALRALLFDVQGTATDFHSTLCCEAQRISAGRHPDVDWAAFVNAWRAAYFTAVDSARPSREKWISVHSMYRAALRSLLDEYGIADFSADDQEELTLAWQRLAPWPDVVPGLTRLKEKYTLATLSNADVSAVVNISKRAGLPWDAVFTAEMAGVFKPNPAIYRMAAQYLTLPPAQIMMVASHKYDIRAAAALGFQTAFVTRPLELGPHAAVDVAYDERFDVNATDFLDLAEHLDC
ncbi:MAG TPA: haloacid dehalogenase type II [Mycobacterium sp.]|uniref:haloacid dehalogenase type II n=1 Tax=Mycobacterium sp. TaxID=1785 RepID=UPI002D35ACC3|nr:haloacid dehalogenase type II [Mycobacterium sp.]HZU49356.1 haloacid dehalogenase type II [Mycobacterium sp.]